MLVNKLRGLTSVHPASIELMRSHAAGELQILRRVRVRGLRNLSERKELG